MVSLCWVRNAELKKWKSLVLLCQLWKFTDIPLLRVCLCGKYWSSVSKSVFFNLENECCSNIMNEEFKRNVCINSVRLPGYSLSAGLDSAGHVILGVSADDAFSVNLPFKCRLNFFTFYSLKLGLFVYFMSLMNNFRAYFLCLYCFSSVVTVIINFGHAF